MGQTFPWRLHASFNAEKFLSSKVDGCGNTYPVWTIDKAYPAANIILKGLVFRSNIEVEYSHSVQDNGLCFILDGCPLPWPRVSDYLVDTSCQYEYQCEWHCSPKKAKLLGAGYLRIAFVEHFGVPIYAKSIIDAKDSEKYKSTSTEGEACDDKARSSRGCFVADNFMTEGHGSAELQDKWKNITSCWDNGVDGGLIRDNRLLWVSILGRSALVQLFWGHWITCNGSSKGKYLLSRISGQSSISKSGAWAWQDNVTIPGWCTNTASGKTSGNLPLMAPGFAMQY